MQMQDICPHSFRLWEGMRADTALAGHYGFTTEELDFILNYGIKYRLGRETETDEE